MSRTIVGVTVGTSIGVDSLFDKLDIDKRIEEYLQKNPPKPGEDGRSPTVSIDEIEGGYRITISDINGTDTVDVLHGADGAKGASFTPSIDEECNLSWSNDQGLENPPTVNIKGLKGEPGDPYELTEDDIKRIIDKLPDDSVDTNNVVEF